MTARCWSIPARTASFRSLNKCTERFLQRDRSLVARREIAVMPFSLSSYFVGVGTVSVAIAVGFGGGLLLGSTDHKPEPPNRLERVTASAPANSVAVAAPQTPLPVTASDASPPASPSIPANGDPTNGPIRKVEMTAAVSPAAQAAPTEINQPQQVPVVAEDAPAKPSRSARSASSPTTEGRVREGRKVAERSERADRRKSDGRRWAERKSRDVMQAPATTQREPLLVREIADSDEEPAQRFSFFGQD